MKCPGRKANVEYYDILVLTNTADLKRHMDYKDDHREYYNHCFFYAFSKIVCEKEYKTSVIMTTRRDLGSAIQKINKDACKKNKQTLNALYN